MYTPEPKELEEMGFTPQSWEGVIYRWDYGGLVYHTGDWVDEPDDTLDIVRGWDMGRHNSKLNIQTRAEVEFIIKLLIPEPPEEEYDDDEEMDGN